MKKKPALRILSRLAGLWVPFLFGLLFLLVQIFLKVRTKENQLEFLGSEVDALEQKVAAKKEELIYRESSKFIYKEALEQMGWTKPGEVIVVLPDFEDTESPSPETSTEAGEEGVPSETPTEDEPVPYWKQWQVLFFGN